MDNVVGIGKKLRAQDNTPRLCTRYHEIQRWSIRGTCPSLEKRRDINLKINDLRYRTCGSAFPSHPPLESDMQKHEPSCALKEGSPMIFHQFIDPGFVLTLNG